jgi:adenylate cyclase
MHARAASTILKGTGLRSNERPAAVLTSIIIIAAIAVLFYLLSPQIAVTGAFLIFGFVYFLSRYLYSSGYFLPVLEGICSGSLFSVFGSLIVYFEKEVDRKLLFNTFSTYLSSDIINEMHKERIKPELGGEMVYATAFFSDIENFTTISEQLSPVDLISYLNEYFSTMTGILLNNNGTLDKYIGDSIVAFFGHQNRPLPCIRCCRRGTDAEHLRLRNNDERFCQEHLTAIKMRIGINTDILYR